MPTLGASILSFKSPCDLIQPPYAILNDGFYFNNWSFRNRDTRCNKFHRL